MTRRLRRGLGLAVPRGAHTFLSVAKEKCAKESQRHGDYGKKPFIAHFDGGARYVARSMVGQISYAIVRARSSPFSAAKMGGPFSLRCLSPLCSPAVGVGQAYPLRGGILRYGPTALRRKSTRASVPSRLATGRLTPCRLGLFGVVGKFCGVDEQADFFFHDWRRAHAFLAACNHWGEFYIDSKMQGLSLDAVGEVQALFLFR